MLQGLANTGLETTTEHRGTLIITTSLFPLKLGLRRKLKPENEHKWKAVVALSSLAVQYRNAYSLNIMTLTFFVCLRVTKALPTSRTFLAASVTPCKLPRFQGMSLSASQSQFEALR